MHDTDADDRSALPPVVPPEQWHQARDALLVMEKRLTRALDALAAERRRLPVVEFSDGFGFDGPDGSVDLLGLFAGRRRLVVYHFMFEPREQHVCAGCSAVADSLGRLAQDALAWGGAAFAQSLTRLGLVDEYRLILQPVALGDGLPLFKGLAPPLRLELVDAQTYNTGAALHVYRPALAAS